MRKIQDRSITRANKKKYQSLDRKTVGGINDPTPHEAVENIRRSGR